MKLFGLLLLLMFSIACSTKLEKSEEKITYEDSLQIEKRREYAKQLFIDASLLDVEGKYAEAILDYQEALKLDPNAGIYYALGKDYLRLNKLLPALENAKAATNLDKKNVEYLTLLGSIFNMSRNADSAEVIFNKILKIDSLNINALYNLGQLYETKQPLKALKFYSKVIDITGPEWNILLKVAEINERLGKVDETIRTAEELLELNPSSLELQKLLIESYIKNNKLDEALKMVDDVIEIFPDDIAVIELRANVLIKKEMWDEGSNEFSKIISNDEIPFDVKMKIGTAFYSEALNDSLVIPYAEEILIEIDKDSSDWQINAFLGELSNRRNDDSLTLFYFKKSIDLAQLNSELRIRLGQILFEKGDYTAAAIEMENAVLRFPNNNIINLILGLSLAQSNDHNGALPYLKKSATINPNDLNATLAYSFSLNQTQQDDEALVYLDRALRIDPKNTQALGMMGLIYDGKDLFNQSDSIYSIAVSIDSTDIIILNNFAYSLAERGVDLDKAYKMVKKAVDEEPENSSYLDTIGWVLYRMGDYSQAEKYINEAMKFDENNSTLLDHLGDILFKIGKEEKAKEIWESALQLDSNNTEIKNKIEKGIK